MTFEIADGRVDIEVHVDESIKRAVDRIKASRGQFLAAGRVAGGAFDQGFNQATTQVGKRTADRISERMEEAGARGGRSYARGFNEHAVRGARGAGVAITRRMAAEVDRSPAPRRAGQKAGEEVRAGFLASTRNLLGTFGSNARGGLSSALGDLATGLPAIAGGVLASGFGAMGASLAAGLVGGLSTALVSTGFVGLGAFLLKDNEKVRSEWKSTFEEIADDAKRYAEPLAQPLVRAADQVQDAWKSTFGPGFERIMRDSAGNVDILTTSLIRAGEKALPGVERAVANSELAMRGFGSLVEGVGAGVGGFFDELARKPLAFQKALELAGEGAQAALTGVGRGIGSLAQWFADNEDDVRRWGSNMVTVIGDIAGQAEGLADVVAAIGGDGRNGKGDSLRTAIERLLMGEDYKPADPGDGNDIRNLLPDDPQRRAQKGFGAAALAGAGRDASGLATIEQRNAALAVYQERLAAVNDAQAKLTYLESIGITTGAEYVRTKEGLIVAQDNLARGTADYTNVVGASTTANRALITTLAEEAAAGRPVSASLLGIAGSLDSASLAATGATVQVDQFGNAVINVPGEKPVKISSNALAQYPELQGVVDRLAAMQDKTITLTTNQVTNHVVRYNVETGAGQPKPGQVAYFNDGGWVEGEQAAGPTQGRDSVTVGATPGEFIVRRDRAYENRVLLETINGGGDVVAAARSVAATGGRAAATVPSSPPARAGGPVTINASFAVTVDPYGMSPEEFLRYVDQGLRRLQRGG